MRGARGLTAALVLVMVGLVAILAFGSAGLWTHHLAYTRHCLNASQARGAAESVLALAIDQVLNAPEWGKSPTTPILTWHGQEGASGSLSFQPGDEPYSTNNLASETSMSGWNSAVVPDNTVRLIGLGRCRGVERRIEMVLHVPPYPYAIACSGRFDSDGNLLLASLPAGTDLGTALAEGKLTPSRLAANAPGADALRLGPGTQIIGDVRSAGDVTYDPARTDIQGEVIRFGDPVRLPQVDLTAYDPLTQGRQGVQSLPDLVSSPTLEGWTRRSGDLNVLGGLVLDGGVLFVDGNLNVQGGVTGTGALIVTGQTTLSGGANLASDNRICLLSGGRIAVRGNGIRSSYFNGLMYSSGGLEASDATLVGTFICNSSDCDSVVKIGNATVVQDQSTAKMEFAVGQPSFGLRSVTSDGYVTEVYPVRYPQLWSKVSQANNGSITLAGVLSFLSNASKAEKSSLARTAVANVNPGFKLYDPAGNELAGGNLVQMVTTLAKRNLRAESWTLFPLSGAQTAEVYGPSAPTFTFDLNRFLPPEDNMEVLLCRPLPGP